MKKVFFTKINKQEWLLILFWVLLQSFIFFSNGIKVDGEALRFIRESKNLISNENFSTPIYFMYFIEIFLLYIKAKLSIGFGFIAIIQLSLNLFAFISFYRFIKEFYRSGNLAFIASLLFLICIPYQLYNSFIYTESIFFSLSILYSCFLLKIENFSLSNIIKIGFWLVLLCLTRPTGIFFFAATIAYWFFKNTAQINIFLRGLILILFSGIGLFILNKMMGSGTGVNILLPFKEEHIICDLPTSLQHTTNNQTEGNSIYFLIKYIFENPSQFFKLAFLRTVAFFGLTRNYFSLSHNIFISFYFYPLYAIIIFGLIKFRRTLNISFAYFFSLIFMFWLAVIFSCDEWHNRFFLTLTPFIIILAILPISKFKFENIAVD